MSDIEHFGSYQKCFLAYSLGISLCTCLMKEGAQLKMKVGKDTLFFTSVEDKSIKALCTSAGFDIKSKN